MHEDSNGQEGTGNPESLNVGEERRAPRPAGRRAGYPAILEETRRKRETPGSQERLKRPEPQGAAGRAVRRDDGVGKEPTS